MGFFDRVKRLMYGEPKQILPLSTSQIATGTTDTVVRYLIEKFEPSLANAFEKFTTIIVGEIQKSEERLVQRIEALNLPFTAETALNKRITREDVLAEFDKSRSQKLQNLKEVLKASRETLNYHLNNLIKDGIIMREGGGLYYKVEQSINRETPKEADKQAEEGLKELFRNDESA